MSKDMEKLIEEIGQIVTESISGLLAPSTDEEYSRVKREIAKRLITRICKAYADGLPLLDEVGRHDDALANYDGMITIRGDVKKWLVDMAKKGAIVLIALREEPE